MFNGLNSKGYQPIPDTDEFSGWVLVFVVFVVIE